MRVYSVRPLPPASRPSRAAEPFLWLQRGHFYAATRPAPNVETIGQNRTSTASSANPSENGSKSSSGAGMLPPSKESHTAAHRGKQGGFLCGVFMAFLSYLFFYFRDDFCCTALFLCYNGKKRIYPHGRENNANTFYPGCVLLFFQDKRDTIAQEAPFC